MARQPAGLMSSARSTLAVLTTWPVLTGTLSDNDGAWRRQGTRAGLRSSGYPGALPTTAAPTVVSRRAVCVAGL